MRKIPTLFMRDPDDMSRVTDEIHCGWVLAGEGVATRKYDGTCVMLDGHAWWARREVKPGKLPPPDYRTVETDEATGKTVGWEPMDQSPFVKAWCEAFENDPRYAGVYGGFPSGTYELCGPKINRNPEGYERHRLVRHADAQPVFTEPVVQTAEQIKTMIARLAEQGWEGIVWHHPDGRMAKLKARDLRTHTTRKTG